MANRPVNDTATSHYAILGVSRGASADDIKRAYHHKAKSSHPDAGGSVTAMARVNAAYQILSDPIARRDYDLDQAAEASSSHQTGSQPHPASSRPSEQPPSGQPFHVDAEAAQVERQRVAWARRSAWELLRFTAPLAAAGFIARLVVHTFIATTSTLLVIGLVTFLPVYLFVLSLIFLTDPGLRLVFADLVRRHPTTKPDRTSALVVFLAFFPLSAICAFWR